ncbi:MAG: rhomboid family intramembrane serine protease [Marinilabiliaceae bacterium]
MASIASEIRESFKDNDIIIKLIYINTAVFLILRLMDIASLAGYALPGWGVAWLGMPVGAGIMSRPWTIVTNIFAHYEFLHYLFNMLTLYWFGRIFMQVYGSERRALVAYVVGGLTGCAASFAMLLLGMGGAILLGASASIMSLMLAATTAAPDRRLWVTFFGEVKLKYVALVYVLLSVIMLIGFSNVGGNLAHLGGALAGWLLTRYWAGRREADTSVASLFRRKPKMRISRGTGNPDWDYNKRKVDNQRELDRILEKINARGYNSLTEEEKLTLFNQSRK